MSWMSDSRPSSDQASRLRQLTRQARPSAVTIAVVSGKGGVGKSSVAANLAICFSARGLATTLVDVDLGLANADLLLGLHARLTLAHVVAGSHTLEDVLLEGPGGIRFIPGASGLHDLANLSEFERQNLIMQLQKLENNTDIVVLDCGAGLSKNVTGFALAADRVLVVTTPQPTALTDAYATIKALHRERCSGQLGLFVNMVESRSEARIVYRRVADVAQKFLNLSVADIGYMVHDTAVELAVQTRCPFVIGDPGSNASACIAAVARRIAQTMDGRESRGGFFRRVAGLFV